MGKNYTNCGLLWRVTDVTCVLTQWYNVTSGTYVIFKSFNVIVLVEKYMRAFHLACYIIMTKSACHMESCLTFFVFDYCSKSLNSPWISLPRCSCSATLSINLNAIDVLGKTTAFHLACGEGHSNVVKIFMENSITLNIDLNAKDIIGQTAFHSACFWVISMWSRHSLKILPI